MDFKAYWLLTKFIAPLALTIVAVDLSDQVLNRGLSSAKNATEMLAIFGIAYTLTQFASGPFQEFKNVSLVLVHNKKEARIGLITLFLLSAIVITLALLIAYTDFGYFITHTLFRLDEDVGQATRKAVLMLSFIPLFHGMSWYVAGYLLQLKHTTLVGSASVMDVAVQIGTVFGLLKMDIANTRPVLVPVIAVYTGILTRFSILFIGFLIHRTVRRTNETQTNESSLSILRVLMFWWPLAIVQAVQKISRPMINLFVARDLGGSDEAVQAIAVLTLVYPTGRIPYGWLNELKSLQPAFLKNNQGTLVHRRHIRNFDICCLSIVLMISFSLFWIPGIVTSFYTNSLDLSMEVALMCVVPLKIFSVFPLFTGWRSHNTSWLLMMKKTAALFPSAVIRMVFLIIVLIVFPKMGLHGAPLGVAALLAGFVVETISVQIASFITEYRMKRNQPAMVTCEPTENAESSNDGELKTSPLLNGDTVYREDDVQIEEGEGDELIEMDSNL
ncbi:progressive ankylosis protein homolog isoform X1 [Anneissia japonica]|uniref:progressive ankylosis protein homolog isoform X1 n=1 Tax=Anneissia japonica TaxID=1529436 RepID=UPI001425B91A|nr:progressive ankylosis protein homolog isoform X1 [Anneissia japonica]